MDPTLLPEPNHVVLNHTFTLSIRVSTVFLNSFYFPCNSLSAFAEYNDASTVFLNSFYFPCNSLSAFAEYNDASGIVQSAVRHNVSYIGI